VIDKCTKSKPKNQVNIPLFRIEQSRKADFTANSGMFLIAGKYVIIRFGKNFGRVDELRYFLLKI